MNAKLRNIAKIRAAKRTFEQAYLPMMSVKDNLQSVLNDVTTMGQSDTARHAAALRSCVWNLQSNIETLEKLETISFEELVVLCSDGVFADV
jgi:hypothetical protein